MKHKNIALLTVLFVSGSLSMSAMYQENQENQVSIIMDKNNEVSLIRFIERDRMNQPHEVEIVTKKESRP